SPLPVFKTGALNHSATLPHRYFNHLADRSELQNRKLAPDWHRAISHGSLHKPNPVARRNEDENNQPPKPNLNQLSHFFSRNRFSDYPCHDNCPEIRAVAPLEIKAFRLGCHLLSISASIHAARKVRAEFVILCLMFKLR